MQKICFLFEYFLMKIVYISNLVVDNALCQEIVEIVETGCQLLVNQIQMHMIFSFILLFTQ